MSNLDLLPVADTVGEAPQGWSYRQRVSVAGLPVEKLDAEVEAVGGQKVTLALPPRSGGLRIGRRVARAHTVDVYLIPDSALSG
jgi:hypothetical protein